MVTGPSPTAVAASPARITREHLADDLRAIGVRHGDHLAIGVSFKSLGRIEGGPDTFIDALVDAVGPDGTLLMNTFTEFFNPVEVRAGWTDYVFDVDSTVAKTGIVPECFRKREGSIRSRHPTNSVAALGKYADYLTRPHDEHAPAYVPFARLADLGGKYLAVGIGDKLAGLRHQAQWSAGLLDVVPWVRVVRFRREDGQTQLFTWRDRGGCTRRLPELVSDLRENRVVREGTIGDTSALLVPVKESLHIMTAALRQHPERNLCDHLLCYWCRELERRRDLFDAVAHPQFFQRSALAIRLVAVANQVREADFRVVGHVKNLVKRYYLERRH